MKNLKIPTFNKYDRYKASSYRAYNQKMPAIYYECIWMKVFQIERCDQMIIAEIGENISSSRILDVGCATGRLLEKLGQRGAKNLSGVDLAPNILEVAQRKLKNSNIEAELKIADAEDNLPWADNSFDYAILSAVIHHFFKPTEALEEIYRVLDKSGKLIILEPWLPIIIRQIINLWLFLFPHDGDCHFYTPNQIVYLISKIGLNEIDYRKVGFYSYIVTGIKS